MENRRKECCPWRGTRFVTFGTISEVNSDTILAEYGHADVTTTKVNSNVDRLFAGLGDEILIFMSHFDKLVRLPTVCEMTSFQEHYY
jgi:GMP synthase-like glutamine amidotransferase